jgi:hypothetical protein
VGSEAKPIIRAARFIAMCFASLYPSYKLQNIDD